MGKTQLSVEFTRILSIMILLMLSRSLQAISMYIGIINDVFMLTKDGRGSSLPPGWSAIGGQIQSAYTTGDYEYDDLGLGNSVCESFFALRFCPADPCRVQVDLQQARQ